MNTRKIFRLAASAALVFGGLAGCDLVEPTTTNPNQVPLATLQQLFTSAQVTSFYYAETEAPRMAVIWMNQMAGTDRQFAIFDIYTFSEGDAAESWSAAYTDGGLVAIRQALDLADEAGCRVCAGILKVHESFFMGSHADFFGDVPYTEAAQGEQNPNLDPQLEVYEMVIARLDEAIADLESGQVGAGAAVLQSDLNFQGDPEAWIDVAHSLKARFLLHLTEVQPDRRAAALEAARLGIQNAANNWLAVHSETSTEANLWNQFTRDRSGYMSAGANIVGLMNGGTPNVLTDDDPRLHIYFTASNGLQGQPGPLFIGSPPGSPQGDPGQASAQLNRDPGGAGSAGYDLPIVSCAETQAIIAEILWHQGDMAGARNALEDVLRCQEQFFGVELLDADPTLTGMPLLRQIMNQKYIALFLNHEPWNDWKRLCLPEVQGALERRNSLGTVGIPSRMFYGIQERQANPNVPPPTSQPVRNPNDPATAPCQTGGADVTA